MTSKELNAAIEQLEKLEELPVVVAREGFSAWPGDVTIAGPKEDTGKKIFYWGWFWREVNFDLPIVLAWDTQGLTGFCENNKWGYPEITLTQEQSEELRTLCETAATSKSADSIKLVNNFMMDCRPINWRQAAEMARK